ncbi:MAG: peptide chain release factor N(5)-glutamine methyltransferase [Chloroflexi bacterium]|nr:peptide chain release factor N(5)-glutamine methyltransferase [Chloroflexota bacterium]
MTTAEALRDAQARLSAAGIDDARLEADVLLSHALRLPRSTLLARLRETPNPDGQATFEALLRRRLGHEPTAYIIGCKEFYGLELACTPAALIPRPETELLVEYALGRLRGPKPTPQDPRPSIIDVGTGNGAIAVALAAHLPSARIVAIDTSRAALTLARRNAEAHAVADQIAFVQGSLLAPLRGRFDLIVANLPYIPSRTYATLPPEIREHEPTAALHAGRRGTALIGALLAQAASYLQPDGLLLAEHAWNQGSQLREAALAALPSGTIETKRDLAGRERMLVVEMR